MRDKWLHVKLTEEERLNWQAQAAFGGVTLADLIRRRMGKAAESKRDPIQPRRRRMPAPSADPALIFAFAKIGNNLNQLARWANTHKSAADAVQVLTALATIETLISSFLPPVLDLTDDENPEDAH